MNLKQYYHSTLPAHKCDAKKDQERLQLEIDDKNVELRWSPIEQQWEVWYCKNNKPTLIGSFKWGWCRWGRALHILRQHENRADNRAVMEKALESPAKRRAEKQREVAEAMTEDFIKVTKGKTTMTM